MTRRGTARGAGRAGREDAERPAPRWPAVILRVAGSGLLIATAAIHLDLYLTGYRTIPTIGWLFLLQVIAAFGLGLAVLAIPSRLVTLSRLAAGAGAGFALATLGGYLLSVWTGLFGFKEVRTTRRHRRRRGGGGRVRGPGRARACSRPGEGRSRPRGSGPGPIPHPDPAGGRPGGRQ